ncbi:hypothetical protein C8F01DRAFT_635737 [Mycena amicta]|nr:hypothetical protein C8F01DRAFT_635737 [Mycena amicta]
MDGFDGAVSRAADGWQTTNASCTRGRSPLPQSLRPQARRPCPFSAAIDRGQHDPTIPGTASPNAVHRLGYCWNALTLTFLGNPVPGERWYIPPRRSRSPRTASYSQCDDRYLPCVSLGKTSRSQIHCVQTWCWPRRRYTSTTLSQTGHAFRDNLEHTSIGFRLPASSGSSRPETPYLRGGWPSSRAWVALGLGRGEGSGRAFVVMLLVHPMSRPVAIEG